MVTPEGKVKRACTDMLKAYTKVWYFMPVSMGMGKHGVPDIICCVDGMFFSIETKAPGKKPTALQEKCMGEIRKSGGKTFVVSDGVSLLEVKKYIEGVLNGNKRKRDSRVSEAGSDTGFRFWSDPQ